MRVVQVKVKPNSGRQSVQAAADGSFLVHLKSSPVDGKANEELIKLLAKQFSVPRANISIKVGVTSRTKLVEIAD